MDTEDDEHFDTLEQFALRIQEIVHLKCDTHEEIDEALRAFISAVQAYYNEHEDSQGYEDHVEHGCSQLLQGELCAKHRHYVRRQFIYSLIEDDDYPTLQIMTTFLITDGRNDEDTFVMMQKESMFSRLVELIKSGRYDETPVHRMLLELLCEMTRIQQLSRDDLQMVDDAFLLYLFQLIERLSNDVSHPYQYAMVRLLLVLNEQYMCFTQDNDTPGVQSSDPLPNRIVKILSMYGPAYRSLGESLILLLNREIELGPQLLILKLLYVLFTNPQTFEYFYTNDLHVLVDVIMRNLVDLDPGLDSDDGLTMAPDGTGQRALRHTYLRVLYPLLKNTQLAREGGDYKREPIRRTLRLLASSTSHHFAPADSTVVRLVKRCRQIDWIKDESDDADVVQETSASPVTDSDVAKRLLGMNNLEAGLSTLSVLDVTAKVEKQAKKERPLVPPRRRGNKLPDIKLPVAGKGVLKVKPMMPKPRRSKSEQVRDRSPFLDDDAWDD